MWPKAGRCSENLRLLAEPTVGVAGPRDTVGDKFSGDHCLNVLRSDSESLDYGSVGGTIEDKTENVSKGTVDSSVGFTEENRSDCLHFIPSRARLSDPKGEDGGDYLTGRSPFEEQAGCPREHTSDGSFAGGCGCEQKDVDVRLFRPYGSGCFDTVEYRHIDVHDNHVRPRS